MRIRPFDDRDLLSVALIHEKSFPRQGFSNDWIRSLSGGFPRTQIFVAEDVEIIGYIIWTEKSGFRKEAVLELEQIAVAENFRGRGFGKFLIEESLKMVRIRLFERGSCLKLVLVSTRTDNAAQKIYEQVLKAKTVAIIPGLFSGDEVLMRAELLK